VTLECVVTANPTHTSVQWQKLVNNQYQTIAFNNNNNKYSGSTVNTPSLTLSSSDLNDEGYYICTATNSLGTGQSSQTFLDVIGSKGYKKNLLNYAHCFTMKLLLFL
jgi:hypothetical protein